MPYRVQFAGITQKITLNLDPIFKVALGKELPSLHGLTGREAYHVVWPAVAMIFRPDDLSTYKALEPKKYGTLLEAQRFLVDVLELCTYNPTETIIVELDGVQNPPTNQANVSGGLSQSPATDDSHRQLVIQ